MKGVVVATSVANLHSESNNLTKDSALTEKGGVITGRGDTPTALDADPRIVAVEPERVQYALQAPVASHTSAVQAMASSRHGRPAAPGGWAQVPAASQASVVHGLRSS